MKNITLGVVVMALLATPSLDAQQIVSDRPGIGSGSGVVPHHTTQLEAGFDYRNSATSDTYSFGQALVRFGLSGFEVDVFANSYVVTRTDLVDDALDGEGFVDVAVGLKVPLVRSEDGRFNLSAQGILQIPTGSEFFTTEEWIPAGILLADVGLTARLGLSVNAGYQAGPGAVDEVFSLIITPGVSLGGGFGVYAGWAGFFADADNTHFAEGGFTFLPNDRVQLDVNGGWDLDSQDYFLGFGIAFNRS